MQKQIPALDGYEVAVSTPAAFTGATGERGDKDGASGAWTIFQVNGEVVVRIFGVSSLTPVGTSGTLEVGVAGNTAGLIALTTATGIATGDLWSDSTPSVGVDLWSTVLGPYVIVNGADIIETTKTTDLTAGNIYYVCLYKPLSPGSSVKGVPITGGATIRGY
jgi:hypothetical protein